MKGNETMIYLKIDNGKGYFLNAKNSMQEIHELRKEVARLKTILNERREG